MLRDTARKTKQESHPIFSINDVVAMPKDIYRPWNEP